MSSSGDPGPQAVWPEGCDRVLLETVDSTMAEAARQARTLTRPTWFLAMKQTEARGRRGRTWTEPPRHFAATYLCKPACTPAEAAKRSFMAANALFETLAMYVERPKLKTKWPNDVLLNGGKVAGVLLESSGRGPYVDWLSIGFGVNLAGPPEGVEAAFRPVGLETEGGRQVTRKDFLTVLASNLATQEAKWDTFGFPRIREDWLSHAARIGEEVTARTGRETVRGLFDTVDQDGNLILITSKGPRAIAAAEVFF